jgi:DNA-binding NarL/FixJ family response regulator
LQTIRVAGNAADQDPVGAGTPSAAGRPHGQLGGIEVTIVCRAELLLLGLERLLVQVPDFKVFTYSRLPEGDNRPSRTVTTVVILSDRQSPDVVSECERAFELADGVVLLWGSNDLGVLTATMAAGARAFVMEGDPPHVLTAAIRSAARGSTYVGQRALDVLVDWLAHQERAHGGESRRGSEDKLLRLLAEGRSTAEIAERLGVAPKTVRNRASKLYRRLGVHSRAGAVKVAEQRGLLER